MICRKCEYCYCGRPSGCPEHSIRIDDWIRSCEYCSNQSYYYLSDEYVPFTMGDILWQMPFTLFKEDYDMEYLDNILDKWTNWKDHDQVTQCCRGISMILKKYDIDAYHTWGDMESDDIGLCPIRQSLISALDVYQHMIKMMRYLHKNIDWIKEAISRGAKLTWFVPNINKLL